MSSSTSHAEQTAQRRPGGRASGSPPWRTTALGGFYLAMSGVHLGILSADPSTYGPFADGAYFGFVRDGWRDVFMAHPRSWALLLLLGEATIGVCLLAGGRPARTGWMLALAFHLLLMLFGFGIWLYAVPALLVLALGARHDWVRLESRAPRRRGAT